MARAGFDFAVRFAAAWGLVLGAGALAACMTPPRTCASESDCGSRAACVAGRCVVRGATLAIASSSRWVLTPVEIGWVRKGDDVGGRVATLGKGDGALVLLRFDVRLAPEARLVEAYLRLARAPGVDVDPGLLVLHAAPVVGAWDARSMTWATQPAVAEIGAPRTSIEPSVDRDVRLDVRALVERWRRDTSDAGGLAIVTEGQVPTGFPVALGPMDVPSDRRGSPAGASRAEVNGPVLELYVH